MKLQPAKLNPLRALPRQAKALLREWKTQFRDNLRGETIETYFDLTNAAEVNAELAAHGAEPLSIDILDAAAGPLGAARFILANLVCNRAVRRHYPTALHDGPGSPFVEYLCAKLPPESAANVTACFAEPPGEPAKRVLEVREDLRKLYPFALTPRQRRPFLAWLLTHGCRELGIQPESALWYLLELDETSDRGLIPSYLLNPDWQAAVPHALTLFGWPIFLRCLHEGYGLGSRWFRNVKWRPTMRPSDELALFRQAWPQLFRDFPTKPGAMAEWLRRYGGVGHVPQAWMNELKADLAAKLPAQRGVNLVGHYRYASGLQEACRGVATALERQNIRLAKRDLPVHFPCDWRDRERYQSQELFDTTIYVAAANTFPREYYRRSGLRLRSGVMRIAYWYWEVDRLPEEWRPELAWASEVWAPTRFLAEAYRNYVKCAVVPMLPGVELPAFSRKPRRFFDLPEDKHLVLFSFDMGSVMERKNPLGLIEAYRRAFRSDDRVHLCIKVTRGEYHADNLAKLQEACRNVGATLLDRVLIREEALALLASAGCYASLHRAEGLGLGMAESMLLGTPVIGTAYSGNLDFMTPENSFLVNASPVPIGNVPPYPPGSLWAEPDLDHAASLLRKVFDEKDASREIAMCGQREVAEKLSVEAAGQRMVKRLAEIRV